MADIIAFAIQHQFMAGMVAGGIAFGIPFAGIAWTFGYESAMRKVGGWMRARPKVEIEVHGEVPNLPPVRDRRAFPTTPGRYV
jgi:hypothetical protein